MSRHQFRYSRKVSVPLLLRQDPAQITRLNSETKIRFFEEKLSALTTSSRLFPASGMSIRRSFELHLPEAKANLANLHGLLKALDKELDVTMRSFLPKEELARIAGELKVRYGFSSLSKTGDAVAKRVLKRASLKDDEEAQAVRDFLLSEEYAIKAIGEENASRLEAVFARYERARAE